VLDSVVHSMAVTQGIIDAFVVIAALTAVTLILIVTGRAAPLGHRIHMACRACRMRVLRMSTHCARSPRRCHWER